jgi:ribose transport system substrate-binding protein
MPSAIRRHVAWLAWLSLIVGAQPACKEKPKPAAPPRIALVPDGPSPFWEAAREGMEEAEQEFGLVCEYRLPSHPIVELQRSIITDLIERGAQGMIICPVDPKAQSGDLAEACKRMSVLCIRRDAAESDRLCFVGTDEHEAGRLMAVEWAETLPPNSSVIALTISPGEPPDRDRLAGLRSVFAADDRPQMRELVLDPADAGALGQLQEALRSDEGPAALIALRSEYSPLIHDLLDEHVLPKETRIICADDSAATLGAIERGRILRSVSPQPAEMAFHAVRILHAVLGGDTSALPEDHRFLIPPLMIDRRNVDVFLGGAVRTTSRGTTRRATNESSPGRSMDDDPSR